MLDGHRDERILMPLASSSSSSDEDDLLDYVAQYVETDWSFLDLSEEFVPEQMAAAAERRAVACSVRDSNSNFSMMQLTVPSASASASASACASVCPDFVKALVDCLSPNTASDREKWLRVAMVLRNEAAAAAAATSNDEEEDLDEAYFRAWLAFSRKSPDKVQGESDCRKTWDSITSKDCSQRKVSLGSLCLLASQDNVDAYRKAQALNTSAFKGFQGFNDFKRKRDATSLISATAENNSDRMRRLLIDTWPEHFEGRMSSFVLGDQQGKAGMQTVEFRFDEVRTIGLIMQDYYVKLMLPSGEVLYLGSLSDDNVSVTNLTRIDGTFDPEDEYVFMRSRNLDGATLKRMHAREDDPVVHMSNPFTKDQKMCVRAHGKNPQNITSNKAAKVFMDVVSKSQQCVERMHGLTLFQVNNYNVNVTISGNNTDVDGTGPFEKLRDIILERTFDGKLRKLDGFIWRPVSGCPCAYERAQPFKDFLNDTLRCESAYNKRPYIQLELLQFLNNYDPEGCRTLAYNDNLISFRNGVLLLEEFEFIPYWNTSESEGFALPDSIAPHHVDQMYTGSTDTPLLDKLLKWQFTDDVIHCLHVMTGRLLFRSENWTTGK
jgi:hypothetical protein